MLLSLLLLGNLLLVPAASQEAEIPPNLNDLMESAQKVRNLLAAGQMLEAIEFILPEKRNEVLAAGNLTFRNPRVLGVDLTNDPSRAVVRVSLEMSPSAGTGGRTDFVARDPWVLVDDRWYFAPSSLREFINRQMVGEAAGGTTEISEADLDERFNSVFKLKDELIDVGMLVEGERKELAIQIEYSGESPIRIETPILLSLLALDRESTAHITAGQGTITAVIETMGWDGPFRVPLPLIIHYMGRTFDRLLTVAGNVFVPLSFELKTPTDGLPDGEFHVLIRNNSDNLLAVAYVTVDGKMTIVEHSKSLKPGGNSGLIRLQRLEGVDPPNEVTLVLEEPLFGKRFYEFPLDIGPND